MSARNLKVAVGSTQDPFYDDTAYELLSPEEFEPAPTAELSLESFTRDTMCTKCGLWRSEHDWDSCKAPNFTEPTA